jgi:hypothetical protein
MTFPRATLRIRGRTVTAACAPGQEPLARDVLTLLERLAAAGGVRAGMKIRFGWSLLTLRDEPRGGLTVCEPDFAGDPLRDFRPRLDTTLEVAAAQAALARHAGVKPLDATFDQVVLVSRGALASSSVRMLRAMPAEVDTGWTVVADDRGYPDGTSRDPGEPEVLHVYRFLELRRALMPAFAMPPGMAVVVEQDRIVSVIDDAGHDLLIGQRSR